MFVITVCSKLADKPKVRILKKGKSRKKRVLHECVLLCFRWWSIHFLRKALLTVNIHRGREKTNSFSTFIKTSVIFTCFPEVFQPLIIESIFGFRMLSGFHLKICFLTSNIFGLFLSMFEDSVPYVQRSKNNYPLEWDIS